MGKCTLVALDTSTRATGVAKFENGKYAESGTLMVDKNKGQQIRFEAMASMIITRLDEYQPDIIVIEQSIMTRNADTFRLLSMLVGIVYGYCVEHDIEYHSLTPSKWRAYIDGNKPRNRRELKVWSKNKVSELYNVDAYTDDQADAILIGTAYINMWDKQDEKKRY